MNVEIFGLTADKSILATLLVAIMAIQGTAGFAIITIVITNLKISIRKHQYIYIALLLHLCVIFLEGLIVLFLSLYSNRGFNIIFNIFFGIGLLFNISAFISFIIFVHNSLWVIKNEKTP